MKIKALVMISGGLDSLLAAKLICEQGCEVIGLHFKIPFCKIEIGEGLPGLEIKIIQEDLGERFMELLHRPRYGFGSNMNPCIDCKILMFSRAKELMVSLGAGFVVSGEVLGQRPMSQNKQSLRLIQEKSGLGELLLRPLSAHFFPPSLAEKNGWVRREDLLDFNGRLRTPQMRLADKLGLRDYATPAGGCLLTDPCFSKRLSGLIKREGLTLDNLELLKIGRHFRLGDKTRLVVGRDEKENLLLKQLARSGDYLFSPPEDLAGPDSLARGAMDEELIFLASQITSAYADDTGLEKMDIYYRRFPLKDKVVCRVKCVSKSRFAGLFI
ncbi:MAG: tRNA 4-thiouridine(8) synthase ThiI [Candidatus Omnitrophica bacterium]|jgi:tRNA U34 2-thiouridine synthase MnmA/TrmU|nr:tRNA 4-thiouridine(8) synthase ThiI [Candidatus Omnitrophota bacterium]MDD5078023.1 tRNA 4-thiouridine(8) synthase ThiI [Candidatus Omnitrophota bacterium]MDD5724592.1 tRNA 4-thiouridine(8) synthase ThiI [Candidatus Omnitrophota bacterium]